MQFQVPKFLERESKIMGTLTFRQLAYFSAGGVVLLVLYFILPLYGFLICFFLIGGATLSLAFVKREGVPLIQIIPHYFGFFVSSRTYLWQKKETLSPIKLVEKKRGGGKEKEKEEAPLKVAPESKLRRLGSKLEFGIK